MLRKWYVWAFCIVLSGCGRGLEGPPGSRGEFDKYFQAFEKESKARGRSTLGDEMITIQFKKLQGSAESGRCEWAFLSRRIIYVDPERWLGKSESFKESLIFHELGHCLLKRTHDDSVTSFDDPAATDSTTGKPRTVPKSLMNTYVVNGATYEGHREHYLKELFGNQSPPP